MAASTLVAFSRATEPGDLPVRQPTKFEFVINLKSGKGARYRNSPYPLLTFADEVIE